MKILDSDTKNFKELYKKHFDIELSDIEARSKLALLVRQMEIVYQPISFDQLERLVEKDTNTKQ